MQVHPPTFNQPWHSVAAREEEAAAPAAAPAALADPGTEANLQDAAHLRVTALEKLPASSHGATEKPSQVPGTSCACSSCSYLNNGLGNIMPSGAFSCKAPPSV